MKGKATYNVEEIAAALRITSRKVLEMLRADEIEHIHMNRTHHNVRIPRREYERLVKELGICA